MENYTIEPVFISAIVFRRLFPRFLMKSIYTLFFSILCIGLIHNLSSGSEVLRLYLGVLALFFLGGFVLFSVQMFRYLYERNNFNLRNYVLSQENIKIFDYVSWDKTLDVSSFYRDSFSPEESFKNEKLINIANSLSLANDLIFPAKKVTKTIVWTSVIDVKLSQSEIQKSYDVGTLSIEFYNHNQKERISLIDIRKPNEVLSTIRALILENKIKSKS